jgi:hypothetical protein
MSDDETQPEPYPDHDTAWRNRKAEAKAAIRDALTDYDEAVRVAAVSEAASSATRPMSGYRRRPSRSRTDMTYREKCDVDDCDARFIGV